jgi:hypothetical protein
MKRNKMALGKIVRPVIHLGQPKVRNETGFIGEKTAVI